jgi:hypothetical protein
MLASISIMGVMKTMVMSRGYMTVSQPPCGEADFDHHYDDSDGSDNNEQCGEGHNIHIEDLGAYDKILNLKKEGVQRTSSLQWR